jgi:hypothetical protein
MRTGLAQPPQVGTICALNTKTHRLPEGIKLRRGANAPEMFAGLPGSMLIVSIRFIFSHRCTLLAMNSEPLSLRRNSGAPCCSTAFCIRCFQCRIHPQCMALPGVFIQDCQHHPRSTMHGCIRDKSPRRHMIPMTGCGLVTQWRLHSESPSASLAGCAVLRHG